MKVLMISRGVPDEQNPTNGNHEFDYARALARKGVEVHFVGLDLRSLRHRRPLGYHRGEKEGVRTYTIAVPVGAVGIGRAGAIGAFFLRKYYSTIKQHMGTPDVLHSHFTEPGMAAVLFNKKEKLPHLMTEHSSLIARGELPSSLYKAAKKVYHAADAVVAVSSSLKEAIQKQFGVDTVVIPPVVNLEPFQYRPQPSSSYDVALTANLKPGKGIVEAIEAYKRSDLLGKGVFRLFGEGPMRAEIEALITPSDGIVLMGNVTAKELSHYYRRSALFFLPSEKETFGKAYVEAMGSGLAVLGTRCGGPESFVTKPRGLLVPVGAVDEMVAGLNHIYRHRTQYDGNRISEGIHLEFGERHIVDQILAGYEVAISHRCRV